MPSSKCWHRRRDDNRCRSARSDRVAIPSALARSSAFLTHPVFTAHRSETKMMRYLKHLERKDVGLDRSMIPLGSCTMKLNAASEMIPVTWPEFSSTHPFAPADQVQGYAQVIRELEQALAAHHGLSGRFASAEFRSPGRTGRSHGDSRLSPLARRRSARRRSDSVVRARHQSRQCGHGRAEGGRGRDRPARQRRRRAI